MSKLQNIAGILMSGDMDSAIDQFVENAYSKVNESFKYPSPTMPMPDIEEIEDWESDGGCEATDGCWVESDGTCEHGYPSWMLHLGMI